MGKLKTGAYAAVFVLALVGLGISSTRLLDISAEYQRSNIAYRQLREIKGIKGPREVVEDKLIISFIAEIKKPADPVAKSITFEFSSISNI